MLASTTSSRHSRSFTSLSLVLGAIAATACGSFSGNDAPSVPAPATSDSPDASTPKAPPITGTPDTSEINEAFGVFVSPKGQPASAGTREHPLSTIQDGIYLGKRLGKRVYVCVGTFREALVLADSTSIFGGLDCSGKEWRVGAARTRVETPSSPAVRAKDIRAATLLEGLDIVAPSAVVPSGSSIGILADHSGALVVVGSKVTAGDAANGVDGIDGIQLVQTTIPGGDTVREGQCLIGGYCKFHIQQNPLDPGGFDPWDGGVGGTSKCAGASGHDGQSGGKGGSGGLYDAVDGLWHFYRESLVNAVGPGEDRPRKVAAVGTSGAPSRAFGVLSPDGYLPADGASGTDGGPGSGGFGAPGRPPVSSPATSKGTWTGAGGPGGGAGGCPGLAGTAGTGGGASIAVALVESPIALVDAELVAGRGGVGGSGTFGSDPGAGGSKGLNSTLGPAFDAGDGLPGGAPGLSTNGSHGPSVGVLHVGAPPSRSPATKFMHGTAAPAISSRTHKDPLGNSRTIPATPAGVSKDILAL